MSGVVLQSLSVAAGPHVLVREVSLELEPGTWTTVVGPNGAGKTSLVEAVAGVRRPSGGHVLIGGNDVAGMRERERARALAFVPQHPVVPVGMSVTDYVGLGRTAHQGLLTVETSEGRQVVRGVIERLGLTSFANRDVATLSGGERQRAVLARALAQSTTVIVLDEPTTGLDVRHQLEVLALIRREVDECQLTVLATLHDLTLASRFGDRLALIDHGELVSVGEPETVIHSRELADAYGVTMRMIDVEGTAVVVPSALSGDEGATTIS